MSEEEGLKEGAAAVVPVEIVREEETPAVPVSPLIKAISYFFRALGWIFELPPLGIVVLVVVIAILSRVFPRIFWAASGAVIAGWMGVLVAELVIRGLRWVEARKAKKADGATIGGSQ